jgi:hypothetical protein
MTGQPRVVALEGPCCAGKTTLGRLLVGALSDLRVAFVPCYADHAGGGRFLPARKQPRYPNENKRCTGSLPSRPSG